MERQGLGQLQRKTRTVQLQCSQVRGDGRTKREEDSGYGSNGLKYSETGKESRQLMIAQFFLSSLTRLGKGAAPPGIKAKEKEEAYEAALWDRCWIVPFSSKLRFVSKQSVFMPE